MPPETDDDLIIDIPTDEIEIKPGGAADAAPAAEKDKAPAAKGFRPSPLARGDDDGKDKAADAERQRLERERDDAARRAAEAEERAARALELARAESVNRKEAEATSRLREQQAMRAHWAKLHSDKAQIEGALAATQSEAAQAERDYITATETGDAKAAAAAQRVISRAEAAIAQLESGRLAADGEIERTRQSYADYERTLAAPKADPVIQEPKDEPKKLPTPDEWINQVKSTVGEDGAAWLREHREFTTDPKLHRKLLRFSEEFAEDHGQHALATPEFVAALNAKFYPDSTIDDGDVDDNRRQRQADPEPEAPKPRARTPVSAPVSRGNQFFSSRNLNAEKVRLPPKLAAFVRSAGLDPTQYALEAVAAIKAGSLPKNFLDPDYEHNF